MKNNLTERYQTFHNINYKGNKVTITVDKEAKSNINDYYAVELFDVEGKSTGLHIEQCISVTDVWINKVNGIDAVRHINNCKLIIFATNLDGVEKYRCSLSDYLAQKEKEEIGKDLKNISKDYCEGYMYAKIKYKNTFSEEQQYLFINYLRMNYWEDENGVSKHKITNEVKTNTDIVNDFKQSLQPDWQWLPVVNLVGVTEEATHENHGEIKIDANGKEVWGWINISEK